MSRAAPKISVILSFYNEAGILDEVLRRQRAVFAKLIAEKRVVSYELIFINDASKDNSEEILRAEAAKGDIVLINMSRNFGVSECALAGMEQSSGDAVIYMDTDLQDPPEVIPDLIAKWQSADDIEVVYTTRRKREGEHPFKMFVTRHGYRFLNFISNIRLPTDSGDFKLLSRRVVDQLVALKEDKPYLRGLISWIGYRQEQVFYDRAPRFDGRENTKMPVLSRKVLFYWLDSALISFSDMPLKIMLFFGLGLSVTSLGYILVVVFQKLMGWYTPGWPALMCAILLIGGVQIMMLGFIGLYIGSIFREVKDRPRYIVKNIIRGNSSTS